MSDEPEIDIDDTEQTVLIRVVEWTEWIPGTPDQSKSITMHNGITGLVTSASEKLVDVNCMGTGKYLDWDEEVECYACEGIGKVHPSQFDQPPTKPTVVDPGLPDCETCDGTGKVKREVRFGLYVLQATLAQNVSPAVYKSLHFAQNMPIIEELERRQAKGRDKRDDLVVVEHSKKKPPPPPGYKKKKR